MINNPVIFYISAALIIFFALFSVFSKKIINSLLWSVLVFYTAAVIFYVLGSEYNAIIQAAIYGIAVPVLLGISIMFSAGKDDSGKGFAINFFAIIFAVVFTLFFIDAVVISLMKQPESFILQELPKVNFYDVISSFVKGLFINYVWAFELMGLLLTVTIAGIAVFKRKGA